MILLASELSIIVVEIVAVLGSQKSNEPDNHQSGWVPQQQLLRYSVTVLCVWNEQ